MKYIVFTVLVAAIMSGCGSAQNGKIYFMSNRFSGKIAKENTGTCVYENGKVMPLFRYYRCPGVSKDGRMLVALIANKRKTIAVADLQTNEVKEYPLANSSAGKYEWVPNDNNRFVYVGAEYEGEEKPLRLEEYIWNLYIFDLKTKKIEKITSYAEKGKRISSFSIAPDGKRIIYCIEKTPKAGSGVWVKISSLQTKEEEILPFISFEVAWSPNGNIIALQGIHVTDKKREGGSRIILYNIKTKEYKKLDKPGGDKAYLWESDLTYSPDGKKIAFIRHENNGRKTLWTMNADGTGRKIILNDGYYKGYLSWTK